jgi:hypothetical protein
VADVGSALSKLNIQGGKGAKNYQTHICVLAKQAYNKSLIVTSSYTQQSEVNMSAKPTFVLPLGNFLPPTYYNITAKLLESHFFATKLVSIPSTGSSVPLTSNEPDIAVIKTVLEDLVEEEKEIFIVAHSYAITPACEAVKGLGFEERKNQGKSGGVVKFIFVATWLMREGENPPALLGRYKLESSWVRFDVTTTRPFQIA